MGVWVAGEENLLELDLRKNVYGLRTEGETGSHLGRNKMTEWTKNLSSAVIHFLDNCTCVITIPEETFCVRARQI